MSVARARNKSSLAFFVALATILALAVPFAGTALARTDNTLDLNVTPDVSSNATGTTHTLVATVDNPANANVADDCPSGENCQVDFEIESGPDVTIVSGAGIGSGAASEGDTETTPDMTCTVLADQATNDPATAWDDRNQCIVQFTSNTSGTNVIRAWLDDDFNDATFDGDPTEARDPGCATPAGGTQDDLCDTAPVAERNAGQRSEADDTNVVTKTWFGAIAQNAALDCAPETATNPSTGADSSEAYTCTLFQDATATGTQGVRDAGEAAIANVTIDGENLGGANDPDTEGQSGLASVPPNVNTADYPNCGTTDGNGTATCTISPVEAQAGSANICFWADNDGDNVYAPASGDQNDGGDCDTETQAQVDSDITDVVTKTWAARGVAANINCEPESDQNLRGTSHSVTCTVTDQFGAPVQGASVDFTVTGRNPAAADNRTTDASGNATFTYTDSNTPLTAEGQSDTISGCIEPDTGAGCTNAGTESATLDVVQKFWFTTLPTTGDVIIDLSATGAGVGPGGLEDCNNTDVAADKTATNPSVPDAHRICAQVLNATNQPIPGQSVTFTISGPGQFFVDLDNDQTLDANETLAGKTFTTNADANGEAFATIFSAETGTATITATSGAATDTGTKIFRAAAGTARNITCTPERAVNEPGTDHVVSCLVTDRFGNPIAGVSVTLSETGPGRVTSANPVVTNASGEAEFVVSSTVAEEGDQQITATITAPRTTTGPGGAFTTAVDDPCEAAQGQLVNPETGAPATGQPAANAPAGNCADTVTKTWGDVEPEPECNDDIDNDGDRLIDFPDDPGCESAADDDERDFEVPPECTGQGIIAGTDGADVLTGTAGDDVICGFGGNDTLNGLDGDDVLLGGGGDDNIDGGEGADTIEADEVAACLQTGCADGNDTADGGGAKDTIRGHGGNDLLLGGNKNDLMVGNTGDDTIRGQNGWDTIRGNADNDRLVGNSGNDILQGGVGNDLIIGGAGNDTMRGFTGRDNLRGGANNDILKGGSGRDQLRGSRGRDVLDGGGGRDACFGGPGRDTLQRCE